MAKAECVELVSDSRVKVKENGRSAVILNLCRQHEYRRIKVDGCCVTTETEHRADWVIERGDHATIIELKGRGIEHAAKQILATAGMWKQSEAHVKRLCGLIVANQYPRASTTIQLQQQTFARRHGGPLHVVTSNLEYTFEHLFSFRGPLKA